MHKIKLIQIIIVALINFLFYSNYCFSQNINWASLDKEQRHVLNLNAGLDFGLTYGVAYGFQLKTSLPIVLNIEQAHPSGNRFLEDFKTKIGGQIRWFQAGDFQFSTKLQGIFRRFNNPVARLINFGSDLSSTFGYYKPKWYVAADVGFDKAIVTHFKHSNSYKEDFPTVQDGWYEPATGGDFYYGLQTGFSFKSNDLTLKFGNVLFQDFKTKPTIPFYAQLGFNRRF